MKALSIRQPCLRPHLYKDLKRAKEQHRCDTRWWIRDVFGIVLADVEELPFVAWKGARGFFDVPDDYASRAPDAPGHAPHQGKLF